jgi:hypothetical protein
MCSRVRRANLGQYRIQIHGSIAPITHGTMASVSKITGINL